MADIKPISRPRHYLIYRWRRREDRKRDGNATRRWTPSHRFGGMTLSGKMQLRYAREKPAKLFIIDNFQLLITFRLNVSFFFFFNSVTCRYFEMTVFFSIRNCKGKRRISSVNFAFLRMWTEYIANESFKRATCIYQAYKIAEISPSEIREKPVRVLDAPNSQRCIVDVPESFVSTLSETKVFVLRKFGCFFLRWWIYAEIFAGQRIFFFFLIIRAWSLFTS